MQMLLKQMPIEERGLTIRERLFTALIVTILIILLTDVTKKHGYPPDQKFKGKGGNIHSNVNAYSANNNSPFAASVNNLNDAGHNVMPQSHSASLNMTMGVDSVANGLTNEQYEKLMFLVKNTQLQGNIASAGGSGTRAGERVVQPVVNQTMAYQATSNDALGI
ncbi:hypothetical protein M9H77_31689 [Catharanthus roseus]|uniref:Uncharacterized protein n=1 Tax=Catharanthus roseus TaxID=4058 RepID=A0ACC0A224_CATRO|nr:hypothetical protein M9H77_31689 [Catharanthus roseus]